MSSRKAQPSTLPITGLETWEKICRPYPIRVWPRELETVESFGRRLLEANSELPRHRRRLIIAAERLRPGCDKNALWAAIVKAKGEAPSNAFDAPDGVELRHPDGSNCASCKVGTGDQWMCRACSGKLSVGLRPHLEYLICRHHRLWVGSGTLPEEQFEVDDQYMQAEQDFQTLRSHGVVDANTLWELIHVIDPTLADEAEHHVLPHQPFPAAVKLWTLLVSREFAVRFFDPNYTYAETWAFLQAQVSDLGLADAELATRVWHYLRPTALSVRESLRDQTGYQSHWDHDFRVDPAIVDSFAPPMRPLEPFGRYLETSGTAAIDASNWREILTHRSAGHGPSFLRGDKDGRRPAICAAGHRTSIKPVREAGKLKSYLCDQCNRGQAVAGETDITCTHPARAAYFDYAKNAPAQPTQYLAGSERKMWWRCPEGHSYQRSIKGQCTVANPCPVCDHLVPLPGFNTFADLHPQPTKEWHPTFNDFAPSEVTPRSSRKAWFVCTSCSEPYKTGIRERAIGHGCMRCKGNGSVPSPIAERFPALESEWDPALNNGLPFEHARGLTVGFNWKCTEGHVFNRAAIAQSRYGCVVCRGTRKERNSNALLLKYPTITKEFDEERNGIPAVQLNSTDKYWWRCSYGHVRQQKLHHRRFSSGCPDCPLPERIAFGKAG